MTFAQSPHRIAELRELGDRRIDLPEFREIADALCLSTRAEDSGSVVSIEGVTHAS